MKGIGVLELILLICVTVGGVVGLFCESPDRKQAKQKCTEARREFISGWFRGGINPNQPCAPCHKKWKVKPKTETREGD